MQNYEESSARLTAEIESANEEIARLLAEKEKAVSDTEARHAALCTLEDAIAKERQVLESLTAEIDAQNRMVEDLSLAATQINLEIEDTKRQKELLLSEDIEARFAALSKDFEACEARCAENDAKRIETAEKTKEIERLILEKEAAFRALCQEKPKLEAYLTAKKEAYNEIMRQLHIESSRKTALSDMEKNMDGYAKGVKAVLGANIHADIHGVLSKLIHVDPSYVVAIETALGGAAQNVVVGTEADAKAAISYLKETRAGRATFLPISAVRGRRLENERQIENSKGYIGLACDLVTCKDTYKNIVLQLLGGVVVMDNIDNAIMVSRKFFHQLKIVTLDGELFMRGGSVSGGSRVLRKNALPWKNRWMR